jgi:hypothetical protein
MPWRQDRRSAGTATPTPHLLLRHQGPEHMPWMHHTTAYTLIVRPLSPRGFRRSHSRRQVPPHPYDTRDPSSKRWNCGRECRLVILPKCQLPRYIYGSFTCRKSATWDQRLYFPSKGRRADDFFPLKNPGGFSRVWTCKLGYLKSAHYP